ncbi:MAG: cation diffusion facilitator family transporter [Acidiferrobacterales bacterium]|jgi:cation diffusion facilitator family transporter|nr:cation diffusion facilitator family transporter [Acidiferrobacterales bacterium]
MAHGSKRAVIIAITANAVVTILKFLSALATGSASMLNEAIHSFMDTANQGFLYRGLMESERPADQRYAFGHGQKKYLWNLWSAIGLFSIGSGLGMAHAWHAWHKLGTTDAIEVVSILGSQIPAIWVSIVVLTVAILLEGYSFVVAMKEFVGRMRADGFTNPIRYLSQSDDPTLVAVVLEDSVAVFGLLLATAGIGLAELTGDLRWDIAFSAMIAALLAFIAMFLGWANMRFLVDVRDPEAEQAFKEVVESHWEVERYHDVRSIVVDEQHTILVGEIELREEAIMSGLQETIDEYTTRLLETIPGDKRQKPGIDQYIRTRAAVQATIERTESIIEELVENVKQKAPQVSHATIEVEGIATPAEKE